jgi:sugar/nucleoside kinase (ribokinase family)
MSSDPDVLCAGIIVADHVSSPISHLPAEGELVTADRLLLTIGGCAANTAVDLAKMDVSVLLSGCIGRDVFGRVVTEMLRDQGVNVSALTVSPTAATSQTLIVNVAGQDRRFIHTFGANAAFRAADIPFDRVTRCKALYLGGYLLMPDVRQDELIPIFVAARAAGAKTMLDVAIPGPGDYLGQFERLLSHVDVFLPNYHEAEAITRERDPVRQAEVFRRLGAGTVVVTMGADGAVLVNDRVRLWSGTYPMPYVDGSGGGDAFDAGFLFGILHQFSAEDCLRVASALGASCVRAVGTTPGVFTRAECEAFLKQHTLRIERL